MEEIRIGEYIRTKNGIILKPIVIDFGYFTIQEIEKGFDFKDKEEMQDFICNSIVAHSPNIIDLIQVRRFIIYRFRICLVSS